MAYSYHTGQQRSRVFLSSEKVLLHSPESYEPTFVTEKDRVHLQKHAEIFGRAPRPCSSTMVM